MNGSIVYSGQLKVRTFAFRPGFGQQTVDDPALGHHFKCPALFPENFCVPHFLSIQNKPAGQHSVRRRIRKRFWKRPQRSLQRVAGQSERQLIVFEPDLSAALPSQNGVFNSAGVLRYEQRGEVVGSEI